MSALCQTDMGSMLCSLLSSLKVR